MTWSIVAREEQSGFFGIAIATRFFAVGALCPHGEGGVGALSTQALPNPTWGSRGLRLLREGVPAARIVAHLIEADPGSPQRQLHVQDAQGGIAVHTGAKCIDWCGHVVRERFSVAGNMLAGPQVVADTATAFENGRGTPFARRLIGALEAGEAAGGDKRGKQSAALIIWTTEDYPFLSIRVDDHADPLAELRRIEAVSRERFVHFARHFPTRTSPAGTLDRTIIEADIAKGAAAE